MAITRSVRIFKSYWKNLRYRAAELLCNRCTKNVDSNIHVKVVWYSAMHVFVFMCLLNMWLRASNNYFVTKVLNFTDIIFKKKFLLITSWQTCSIFGKVDIMIAAKNMTLFLLLWHDFCCFPNIQHVFCSWYHFIVGDWNCKLWPTTV